MYRNCIFCAADLGENESIEWFPVGRSLAFDAEKGRLWAVCPRCARWNLAPIEERWEAVEEAERRFRDTSLRTHGENVGLAKLPDGTRLIRVGRAVPGEMALWRYGRKLQVRRTRYMTAVGLGIGLDVGLVVGLAGSAITGSAAGIAAFGTVAWALDLWSKRRPRMQSRSLLPYTGLQVDATALRKARFAFTFHGEVSLALEVGQDELAPGMGAWADGVLLLSPGYAQSLLRRGMVELNVAGATAERVRTSVNLLTASGSAERYLRLAAADGVPVDDPGRPTQARSTRLLAVEMAVHEELERRALGGELAALEAAWREAEEIAGVADALPDLPASDPPRLTPG